ncbi:MAG: biotin/lipoyl-binding protein, partial [Bacteroidetes Order II. Incertae sedis bacterium]|nr:biotin/lipoyl-binding protein [Bacteroidetes Order II. bacterium]
MSQETVPDSPPPTLDSPTKQPRRSQKIRAHHWAGIVLFMAIGGILAYAFYPKLMGAGEEGRDNAVQRPGATAKIEAVNVLPMAFPIRVEATGHLAAWKQAEISAEMSGLIITRNIEEGRFVAAGHVLFQLDDRELRLSLREAQTELLKARTAFATQTIGQDS